MTTVEVKKQEVQEKNTLATKVGTALVVAGATAMPLAANAAELDFSGASAELDGAKTAILGIIGALITIGAIVLGWRTFRRSAS